MNSSSEKEDRLINAAVEILRHVDGNTLGVTVLNKSLFYLDLYCLLENGETATGNTYLALEQGPVVANYQRKLVDELAKRGLATQRVIGNWMPITLDRPSEAKPQPYEKLAELVARRIGRLGASSASDLSHENLGWRLARNQTKEGEPAKSIDMFLAMQQLADVDPWLDDELSENGAMRLRDAKDSKGEPW